MIHRIAVFVLALALSGHALADFSQDLKAARRGDVQAEIRVARSYMDGSGVSRNIPASIRHLKNVAATKNYQTHNAKYWLGIIYAAERYGLNNGKEAVKWFEQVVQDRGPIGRMSRFALGDIYSAGDIVPKNYDKAYYWYWAATVAPGAAPPGIGAEDMLASKIRFYSSKTSESAEAIMNRAIQWSNGVDQMQRDEMWRRAQRDQMQRAP